jgi:hypothetical protein
LSSRTISILTLVMCVTFPVVMIAMFTKTDLGVPLDLAVIAAELICLGSVIALAIGILPAYFRGERHE